MHPDAPAFQRWHGQPDLKDFHLQDEEGSFRRRRGIAEKLVGGRLSA